MDALVSDEEIVPERRYVYNVRTEAGFTESFNADTIDILLKLGLIKWERVTSFPDGTHVVFYVKG